MIVGTLQDDSRAASGSRRQTKLVAGNDSDSEIEEVVPGIGWVYVGSHNFTPSAWGTMSGTYFTPILNVSVFGRIQTTPR